MKFIYPKYHDEELKWQFENLKVGDKLIEISSYGFGMSRRVIVRTVTKITPKGYVRLDSGELLKNMSGYYIPTEEVMTLVKTIRVSNKLENLIYNVNRNYDDFREKITLEEAEKIISILSRGE